MPLPTQNPSHPKSQFDRSVSVNEQHHRALCVLFLTRILFANRLRRYFPNWLIFDGTAPNVSEVQLESQAGTPGLAYTVEAFNWNSNSFDVIDTRAETFNTDQAASFPIVPADHIDGAGNVRSRIGWRQTGSQSTSHGKFESINLYGSRRKPACRLSTYLNAVECVGNNCRI